MKKILIIALAAAIPLVGCSDPEPTFEQKLQMKQLEYGHQEAMASIKQQNQELAYNEQGGDFSEESYQGGGQASYESGTGQPSMGYEPSYSGGMEPVSDDSGFSGGALALGVLGGAITGYMASELLDGGWSTGYDSSGAPMYYDGNHRPVSKPSYDKYKRSHKVKRKMRKEKIKSNLKKFKTASKRKLKAGADKVKAGAKKLKDKAKPQMQKAKQKAKKLKQKAAPKIKQAKRKAKAATYKAKKKSKSIFKKAKSSFRKKK